MQDLKHILDSSRLKTTPQRLAILKEIAKQGHASIEEIYENIKESFPSISLATIYKNISALQEEKILTQVCSHQKSKYEITKEPHAHFICQKCGEIEDIEFSPIIKEEIEKDFPNSQKELYIYGVCKRCQES
ncbi:MAG: transcriptional repressor [Epsilonproteobacteria bacterium]|nr:transcriptional repressor [Campylobacterota bacterium]